MSVQATERYELRLQPNQIASYRAAAQRASLPLAAWIRQQLDRAAKAE